MVAVIGSYKNLNSILLNKKGKERDFFPKGLSLRKCYIYKNLLYYPY